MYVSDNHIHVHHLHTENMTIDHNDFSSEYLKKEQIGKLKVLKHIFRNKEYDLTKAPEIVLW